MVLRRLQGSGSIHTEDETSLFLQPLFLSPFDLFYLLSRIERAFGLQFTQADLLSDDIDTLEGIVRCIRVQQSNPCVLGTDAREPVPVTKKKRKEAEIMRKLYKSDQIALDSIEAYYCSCACASCSCTQCGCSCSGDINVNMSNQALDVSYNKYLKADNSNRNMYGPSTLQS